MPKTKTYYRKRDTDGGFTIVSAHYSIHPLTEKQETDSTGLVWIRYEDGMARGYLPLLPKDARRMALDLLAAAESTEEALERDRVEDEVRLSSL